MMYSAILGLSSKPFRIAMRIKPQVRKKTCETDREGRPALPPSADQRPEKSGILASFALRLLIGATDSGSIPRLSAILIER